MPSRVNQAVLNRLRRLEMRNGGKGKAYERWLRECWPQPPTPEERDEWIAAAVEDQAELMRQCMEDRRSR
jgi:hypothetical protein